MSGVATEVLLNKDIGEIKESRTSLTETQLVKGKMIVLINV
jgi:hypothetical protein